MKVNDRPGLDLRASAIFDQSTLKAESRHLEQLKRLWDHAVPVGGLILFAAALASIVAWFMRVTPPQ